MDIPRTNRRYTGEEKQKLMENLDIEVAHRVRQFESWLADRLENYNIHQEGQVLRIPRQVRGMTMREFGEKYEGNVQAALRGYQKERYEATGGEGLLGELDKEARKRKWVESQDEAKGHEPKTPKNARLMALATPKNNGTPSKLVTPKRILPSTKGGKTPGNFRTMGSIPPSPSPQKPRPPFGSNMGFRSLQPVRPSSPSKAPSGRPRPPSSSTFNPDLPAKTPKYPNGTSQPASTLRFPRRDESMLSVNGSPLANPYEFGMGWLKGIEMAEADVDNEDTDHTETAKTRTHKRTKSSIMIRRDPSMAFPQHTDRALHSRTNSQASVYTASSQTSSSLHSRENSVHYQSQSQQINSSNSYSHLPISQLQPAVVTPKPTLGHTRSFSALVAIPTKDGHLLEFDPLETSPAALDALEGITDSAKKHARVEMSRLVQATMDKWKIR